MNKTDLILIVGITIMVILEWRHRAQRDGKKEATQAMLFAGAVFVPGMYLQKTFGIPGLLAYFAIVLVAFVIVLGTRYFKYRN